MPRKNQKLLLDRIADVCIALESVSDDTSSRIKLFVHQASENSRLGFSTVETEITFLLHDPAIAEGISEWFATYALYLRKHPIEKV